MRKYAGSLIVPIMEAIMVSVSSDDTEGRAVSEEHEGRRGNLAEDKGREEGNDDFRM